jgi:hypothetical protein
LTGVSELSGCGSWTSAGEAPPGARFVDGHPPGCTAWRVDDDPLRRRAEDRVGGG